MSIGICTVYNIPIYPLKEFLAMTTYAISAHQYTSLYQVRFLNVTNLPRPQAGTTMAWAQGPYHRQAVREVAICPKG